MGKYNYESFASASSGHEPSKKQFPKIGYFWVGEKKPTAIVRFDVASGEDLTLVDVHNIKVNTPYGTSYRDVACLRESREDPWEKCPLCKHDIKSRSTKVYVRLLEYVVEDGKVVAKPACWSRFSGFANEIMNLLNTYGDLREQLFKVTWTKEGGRGKTTVLPLIDRGGLYTEENGYVKDFSAFKTFSVNKHSYMERTFEEIQTYLETGEMPSRKPSNGDAKPTQQAKPLVATHAEETVPAPTTDVRKPSSQPSSDDPTLSRRRRYDNFDFNGDNLPF